MYLRGHYLQHAINFIYLILANIYHLINSYRKKNFLIKIRTAKLTEPNRHLAEAPELT